MCIAKQMQKDVTVPSWMSQVLYDRSKTPKKLLIVTGGDHNDVASVSRQEYLQTVDDFRKSLDFRF